MLWIMAIHVVAGTLAFFAGVTALGSAKGSQVHKGAGRAFVVTMFATAGAGFVLAAGRAQPITALAGILAAYLVLTGWLSLARRTAARTAADISATIAVVLVAVGTLSMGTLALQQPNGAYQGYPAGDYFFLGTIALLGAAGDLYRLAVGTVSRVRSVARHVWRMGTGMFFATGSMFTGPGANAFPEALRESGLLIIPELAVLLTMLFWLGRLWRRRVISIN